MKITLNLHFFLAMSFKMLLIATDVDLKKDARSSSPLIENGF
jgi:hypothetical protein